MGVFIDHSSIRKDTTRNVYIDSLCTHNSAILDERAESWALPTCDTHATQNPGGVRGGEGERPNLWPRVWGVYLTNGMEKMKKWDYYILRVTKQQNKRIKNTWKYHVDDTPSGVAAAPLRPQLVRGIILGYASHIVEVVVAPVRALSLHPACRKILFRCIDLRVVL